MKLFTSVRSKWRDETSVTSMSITREHCAAYQTTQYTSEGQVRPFEDDVGRDDLDMWRGGMEDLLIGGCPNPVCWWESWNRFPDIRTMRSTWIWSHLSDKKEILKRRVQRPFCFLSKNRRSMLRGPPPSMFEDTVKVRSADSFHGHETLRNLGCTPMTVV